jgi:membrane protein
MTGENLFDFIGKYILINRIFVRLWLFLRFIIIGACVFLVLFLIYCVLPGVRQKISDIIAGTFFSMISWVVISAIFSYYMNNIARYSFLYGSIGAFIILLLWFYLSNTLLLVGCSINSIRYHAKHHSSESDHERIKYKKSKIPNKDT